MYLQLIGFSFVIVCYCKFNENKRKQVIVSLLVYFECENEHGIHFSSYGITHSFKMIDDKLQDYSASNGVSKGEENARSTFAGSLLLWKEENRRKERK